MNGMPWIWRVGLFWLCLTSAAWAHKPSDSYLTLKMGDSTVEGPAFQGQWDIALRDLEWAVGLDANGDGEITWGELRARHADIAAYALARLAIEADGKACGAKVVDHRVDEHTDGAYAVLMLGVECGRRPQQLTLRYTLFADLDPQHRGLLRLDALGLSRTAVLGPQAPSQSFALEALSWRAQLADYVADGVWHIWIGYDHILFLLSLLLPAVLVWRAPRWQAAESARDAFWDVVRIVTAFTVAHSITLSLATLGLVSWSSRWVESAIAASVVLAALNNLYPVVQSRRWAVAFCFGLVHGFGFASVLAGLGLQQGTLALALVGFNVGVELGQLAIVMVFLPLAFWMRTGWFYQRVVFTAGSALIAVLAAVWLVERLFDLELIKF